MKTPLNIHISSVDRLYNDGIITKEEYESIMLRIVSKKVEEKEKEGAFNV